MPTPRDELAALRVIGAGKGQARALATERVLAVQPAGETELAVMFYDTNRAQSRLVMLESVQPGLWQVADSQNPGRRSKPASGYDPSCASCLAWRAGDLTTHRDHVRVTYNGPLTHSGERFHWAQDTGPAPAPFGRQVRVTH